MINPLPAARLRRAAASALAAALAFLAPRAASAQEPVAADLFRRYADRVVKVEISERGSGAKASIGTGFYVAADGRLVTNYHVVSSVVVDPARYRVTVFDKSGASRPATVRAIDVVNDLAVLSSDARPPAWFSLGQVPPAQGTRLYALGHPHDLGLTIVEGTYNGRLEHALYERIHFTGSINPGMSGGPAIASDGTVVGVNVSTAGNQLSFLVPVARVVELADGAAAAGAPLLAEVGRQILDHQRAYLGDLLDAPPTTKLGDYVVPTRPAPFFRCWADVTTSDDDPYTIVDHRCSTEDHLFLAGDQSSGVVELRHRHVSTDELDRFRFTALLEFIYEPGDEDMPGDETHVTSFRCSTRNVARGERVLRAAVCLRRYRKLDGLYDAVVKTVTVGGTRSGVVSTLTLAGVSLRGARTMTERFLESIRWAE